MRKMKLSGIVTSFAVAGAAIGLLLQGGGSGAQEGRAQLTLSDSEHSIHIFPTVSVAGELARAPLDTGPLLYHGGPIMKTIVAYAIFWVPPTLQTGGATSLPAHYQTVQKNLLADYPGHGIGNNNTQYYSGSTTKTYIQNAGALGGSYVDTSAYPASGCSDAATPGACITDAQVQTEIKKVMTLKGWTGGLTHMFLLFTSSGEGSCLSSASTSCAYVLYCAYHSFFISGTTPVIYGNEPFGNTTACQAPGTPSPTSDPAADTAASTASHEVTEAITDPELSSWYTGAGNEIGDLCAYIYATNTWDGGLANEMWNGRFYELQEEFDNHLGLGPPSGCAQVGP